MSFSLCYAKSLQSCLTLCNPIDGSPPGSPIPWILQARTLEWVAISFSSAWKWKVKCESEVTRSCPTPSNPKDCSLPGSSNHGIFQARVLEWGAIAFSAFHYRGLECKSRKSRNTWVTGKFSLGIWNEAGQRLIEFCQENALVIANTLFQQHKRRLYTWTAPDGQHRNQTDYILCSQRWRSSIQSTKTRPGADYGSDHELLIAKFRLKLKKVGTIQVWPKSNPLWLYSGSEK